MTDVIIVGFVAVQTSLNVLAFGYWVGERKKNSEKNVSAERGACQEIRLETITRKLLTRQTLTYAEALAAAHSLCPQGGEIVYIPCYGRVHVPMKRDEINA